MRSTGWGRQLWLVKRSGSPDCDASMARRSLSSTIMMRCWPLARRRASRTLTGSPRISPILRRAGTGSAAKAPWPSMRLRLALTRNFRRPPRSPLLRGALAVDAARLDLDQELLRIAALALDAWRHGGGFGGGEGLQARHGAIVASAA